MATNTTLPCSWNVDVSCCDAEFWAGLSPATQQAAKDYGAFTVWAATGRRFGGCERTVRPCYQNCQSGTLGYYWADGTWRPYILNGLWRNCFGSCSGICSCEPACQVYLPGPVLAISPTGVSQNGSIVPVNAWRVDNGQWLVRTDGTCWPACQDWDADITGANTLFVTYTKGQEVPGILLRAAGELACEWAKSCAGAACRLPQRVQSVARQGVTIQMVPLDDLLRAGLTGVPTVDQVIRNFNPYGLASPMKIASPDDPVVRMTTIA
jgi:hypothetical protein